MVFITKLDLAGRESVLRHEGSMKLPSLLIAVTALTTMSSTVLADPITDQESPRGPSLEYALGIYSQGVKLCTSGCQGLQSCNKENALRSHVSGTFSYAFMKGDAPYAHLRVASVNNERFFTSSFGYRLATQGANSMNLGAVIGVGDWGKPVYGFQGGAHIGGKHLYGLVSVEFLYGKRGPYVSKPHIDMHMFGALGLGYAF
jgi:hypothetical protein